MLLMSHVAMPMLDKPAETTMIGRWFRLRLAGLLLATASIASVLYENQARPLTWFLLAITAIAWPLFARDLGSRSRDAHASELRSLLVDSALAGFWVAVMQFNVLPSVAISVMVICDKIVAGGRVLTIRGLIVQVAACILTMAVHGFRIFSADDDGRNSRHIAAADAVSIGVGNVDARAVAPTR